jgi:hypothetical protein
MILDKETATVPCWLKGDDGTMVVEIAKALYGCVESAKLWYNKLSDFLQSLGFVPNSYDPCVFQKLLTTGEKLTVGVYVDDFLLCCKNTEALEELIDQLITEYKEVTVNRDKVQEYIGMVLDFSEANKCKVQISIYIQKLLEDYDVTTFASSPAESNLFAVREDSPLINDERRSKFHSGVMRLMFLAKRARPDILLPIVFLASRVTYPIEDDEKKFYRVLKYLNGTQDLVLTLAADSIVSLSAYIDAAYGVHNDLKGHSGCVITMGSGVLYVKSNKQKLNAKSSTEAELIALSDALGQVIWTRNFLEDLGYNMEPATVYQDNLSTIAMVKNGSPTSHRTRHINIRFFFAKDRVDQGEIKLEYCPTEVMLADLLTKPLQGALFIKLRNAMMGHTGDDNN